MHRLFLDANVVFSAAWAEHAGFRALWRLTETAFLTSSYAVAEVRRNLVGADRVARLERLLRDVMVVPEADDEVLPAGLGLDRKDEPILKVAIRSSATHLITGDRRHFGHLYGRRIGGVIVTRPSDYLHSRSGT